MTGWAPGLSGVMDNGFGSSRNGKAIVGAIVHHVAGTNGKNYVANANSRNSHPTYHVDRNGKSTGIVHPSRRPHSTANSIDQSAITFEVDNTSASGDYPVSDAAMREVARIIRWHADQSPRRGHAIVDNDPKNTQKGFFVGRHSQYVNTSCPGPYLSRRFGDLIAMANGDQGVAPAPTPTPAPAPAPAGKSVSQLADEVIAGKHGTGEARKRALGGQYAAVQAEVNRKLGIKTGGASAPKPAASSGLPAGSARFSVSAYQRFMKKNFPLYAHHVVVDNKWGPQIAGVTREYQRRKGLQQDGIVGPTQTLPALRRDGFRG